MRHRYSATQYSEAVRGRQTSSEHVEISAWSQYYVDGTGRTDRRRLYTCSGRTDYVVTWALVKVVKIVWMMLYHCAAVENSAWLTVISVTSPLAYDIILATVSTFDPCRFFIVPETSKPSGRLTSSCHSIRSTTTGASDHRPSSFSRILDFSRLQQLARWKSTATMHNDHPSLFLDASRWQQTRSRQAGELANWM